MHFGIIGQIQATFDAIGSYREAVETTAIGGMSYKSNGALLVGMGLYDAIIDSDGEISNYGVNGVTFTGSILTTSCLSPGISYLDLGRNLEGNYGTRDGTTSGGGSGDISWGTNDW